VSVDEKKTSRAFRWRCLLGNIDQATQKWALSIPQESSLRPVRPGLILAAAFGWLTRLYGMSCDNVVHAGGADGSMVHASATENPTCFGHCAAWRKFRGGNGIRSQTPPLRRVLFGTGMCLGDDILGCPVLARVHARSCRPPKVEFFVAAGSRRRKRTSYVADARCQRVRPMDRRSGRSGRPHAITLCPRATQRRLTKNVFSFLDLQTMAIGNSRWQTVTTTKIRLPEVRSDDESIHTYRVLGTIPSPLTQVELSYQGGALRHASERQKRRLAIAALRHVNILGSWSDPAEDAREHFWVRNLFAKLRPSMTPGSYVNFMSGDEDDRTTEAYRTDGIAWSGSRPTMIRTTSSG